MKTTVWVYAPDYDQAMKNANGDDGYGAWDTRARAILDGNKRLEGEKLYKVTTTVTVEATEDEP